MPVTKSHFAFFFFNDTATTEIYTLSLHDALPISLQRADEGRHRRRELSLLHHRAEHRRDRKSTRLNSSHLVISYAVFCLKKKTCSIISIIPVKRVPPPERTHPT